MLGAPSKDEFIGCIWGGCGGVGGELDINLHRMGGSEGVRGCLGLGVFSEGLWFGGISQLGGCGLLGSEG